jgi:hypothetical protein
VRCGSCGEERPGYNCGIRCRDDGDEGEQGEPMEGEQTVQESGREEAEIHNLRTLKLKTFGLRAIGRASL